MNISNNYTYAFCCFISVFFVCSFFQTGLKHIFLILIVAAHVAQDSTMWIKKMLPWACYQICVHLCRNRSSWLPEWVICDDNENPRHFASHLCSSLFFPVAAEIIRSALSKQVLFDNHTVSAQSQSFFLQSSVNRAEGSSFVIKCIHSV